MEVLGPTERAARLPAWLFTLVSLVLVGRWARRRWGVAAGWLAALALATMPLVSGYSRTVIFDSALAACVAAAVLWLWDGRPVLGWVAMGVGVLVKGPIAFTIPLLAVLPASLATGRGARRLFPLAGLAAFFAVTLPWFIAVSLRHPEFPGYVFVQETFQRVTTGRFHRTGPPWYYLPILLVGTFPWIVPALARVRGWRETWQARRVDPVAADAVLLASWVLVPLAFLTLNQSKLPQYLLPLFQRWHSPPRTSRHGIGSRGGRRGAPHAARHRAVTRSGGCRHAAHDARDPARSADGRGGCRRSSPGPCSPPPPPWPALQVCVRPPVLTVPFISTDLMRAVGSGAPRRPSPPS
jgi:hypothetical protein